MGERGVAKVARLRTRLQPVPLRNPIPQYIDAARVCRLAARAGGAVGAPAADLLTGAATCGDHSRPASPRRAASRSHRTLLGDLRHFVRGSSIPSSSRRQRQVAGPRRPLRTKPWGDPMAATGDFLCGRLRGDFPWPPSPTTASTSVRSWGSLSTARPAGRIRADVLRPHVAPAGQGERLPCRRRRRSPQWRDECLGAAAYRRGGSNDAEAARHMTWSGARGDRSLSLTGCAAKHRAGSRRRPTWTPTPSRSSSCTSRIA